jgi:hypothetical protein
MKKIAVLLALLINLSCFAQFDTLTSTYTFDNLNLGNLNGQDGWVTTKHNTAVDIAVTQTGTFNGTKGISFNQSGPSVGVDASKAIGLSFPGFNFSNTNATYIISVDMKHNYWGMDLAIAADMNLDGKVTFQDVNEKALNFYSGSKYGDRLTLPNGVLHEDTIVTNNWTKIEIRISQLNMPGGGVVSVRAKDLTTGIWSTIFNNIALGADSTSNTKKNINKWNMLFLHFEGATGLFDNITISRLTPSSTTIPLVSTGLVSGITSTSAIVGGNVIAGGGAPVTARGICWGSALNPDISGNHTTNGSGTGSFSGSLSGLLPNTIYHARAYATNSFGTNYGSDVIVLTSPASIPVITTNPVTNIGLNSAMTGGEITSDGGSPVTARGVCYNILPNPTLANLHTTDGSGTGSFTSTLTLLSPSTVYYIRAYATNAIGTAYGNLRTFTSGTVGIDELENNMPMAYIANGNLVLANPASGKEGFHASLYSLTGNKIAEWQSICPGETRTSDLSGMAKGIYIIHITQSTGIITNKLIIP